MIVLRVVLQWFRKPLVDAQSVVHATECLRSHGLEWVLPLVECLCSSHAATRWLLCFVCTIQ